MRKILEILLTGILVSMYYFPFEFTFFPAANTKMMMAGVGIVAILLYFITKREFTLPGEVLGLLLLAGSVSLISYFSITYNQTPDKTYVSYIISATVWLSSSFVVCHVIRQVHGRVDVPLIVNYLTGVCLFQCFIALAIEFSPVVQTTVDRWIVGGAYLRNLERIYGIGCALDVAGTRFSCVLVCLSYLLAFKAEEMTKGKVAFLFFAFAVITAIGNMIARTTSVGSIMGIAIMFALGLVRAGGTPESGFGKFLSTAIIILLIVIPVCVLFYRTNPKIHDLTRFAFEGFFSLAEKGKWEVSSNETLKHMVIWPEELRTWIIGDGYFLNQRYDPNYIGDATVAGFYMGTDVGYCRFLFYFGAVGLTALSAVMAFAAWIGGNNFSNYALMFLLVLLAGFIMWMKSSTDIFVFFSLFVSAGLVREEYGLSDTSSPVTDSHS